MKIGKVERFLIAVAVGALAVAIALYFVLPLIFGEAFSYSALDALKTGLKEMASFNIASHWWRVVTGVCVGTIVFYIIWLIIILSKKRPQHILGWALSFVLTAFVDILIISFFLSKTLFNKETGRLFLMIMASRSNQFGKALIFGVAFITLISAVAVALYIFCEFCTIIMTDKVEAQFGDLLQEDTTEKVLKEPLKNRDDRKEREEKLFNEAIATGDFERIEEVPLEKPLEGYAEEPVVDLVNMEESTEVENTGSTTVVKKAK